VLQTRVTAVRDKIHQPCGWFTQDTLQQSSRETRMFKHNILLALATVATIGLVAGSTPSLANTNGKNHGSSAGRSFGHSNFVQRNNNIAAKTSFQSRGVQSFANRNNANSNRTIRNGFTGSNGFAASD